MIDVSDIMNRSFKFRAMLSQSIDVTKTQFGGNWGRLHLINPEGQRCAPS
jgi:hypothetical protein